MSLPIIPFPEAQVYEWNGLRTNSASGLFAYRHLQAVHLLESPDFCGGDMTHEQRSDALRRAVNHHKPLTALAIFLGVVALEDFVRDFGARMADNIHVRLNFPALEELRAKPILRPANQAFMRLDTDPTGVVDPQKVNDLFQKSLGVEPIPAPEYARLRDLALIRHTVAHHAAVVRSIDVPRFQYYILRPGQVINPPVDFVKETLTYLYRIGRAIEEAVMSRVFKAILPSLGTNWWNARPTELLELIEFFDFFGFLEPAVGPVGYAEPGTPEHDRMREDAALIKEKLIVRSILELQRLYAT
jgi:hypothetical protein